MSSKYEKQKYNINQCMKDFYDNKCNIVLNVEFESKENFVDQNEILDNEHEKIIDYSTSSYLVEFCKERLKCLSTDFVYFSNEIITDFK